MPAGEKTVRCANDVVSRDHLLEALQQRHEDEHAAEAGYVKTKIRDTLSRFFHQRTKRRPMILPIVMEV